MPEGRCHGARLDNHLRIHMNLLQQRTSKVNLTSLKIWTFLTPLGASVQDSTSVCIVFNGKVKKSAVALWCCHGASGANLLPHLIPLSAGARWKPEAALPRQGESERVRDEGQRGRAANPRRHRRTFIPHARTLKRRLSESSNTWQ